MYKVIAVLALCGLTSCCNLPVATALDQVAESVGSEYIQYVLSDPKYNENEPNLTETQKQVRREQKEMRLNNIKMLKELSNELRK